MGKEILEEKDLEKELEQKEEKKGTEMEKIKEEKSSKDNQPESQNQEKENKQTQDKSKEEKKKFEKVKRNPKRLEKEKKEMAGPNKKRKWIMASVILAIIILIGIVFSTIFALINVNNTNIISGVKIEGIDVSGLSKEEAKVKIETIYQNKIDKEISIKYGEYESTINPTIIETKYDIEKAVNEAIEIGKKDNIFINNYNILFALIGKKDVQVGLSINEEAAKKVIEDIGINIPGVLIESSYYREDNNLIITKGKSGIKIDTESLLNLVKQRLDTKEIIEDYIDIPVLQKDPQEINIDKIHEEVYKEAKDAYYTKDPFTVYEEVEGVDFDVEAAKQALLTEEKEEYTIPLVITKPKVTIDQIGTEAFPDQLATFTTRYDASDKDRTTNLEIACSKINGKVVLAGESFSYNQTLGERTIAAGYKNAKVYENGQVVDGIGGGICQISSTLYNAVLLSNLEVTERRNHQFVTSYVPAGRDATVVYGMTDFKFKNTRKYPIKIVATAKSGIATVSIYGIKEEEEYTFSFTTTTVSTIPTSTQYVDDPTLDVGTEKVKQKGANGLITETYITKMLNGKVVSKTLLSRDTYNAMKKIVLRGTKGATTQNNSQTTTQTTTNNNQSTENKTNTTTNNNVDTNKNETVNNTVTNTINTTSTTNTTNTTNN